MASSSNPNLELIRSPAQGIARGSRADNASGLQPHGATNEPPPEGQGDFNVPGLLQAFRRRWHVILPLATLVACGTGWLAHEFLGKPSYTARTLLHVSADRPRILYESGDSRSDFTNYQRAQAATVKSRWVLRSALAQLGGRELSLLQQSQDPVADLEKEIQADYTLAPEIMRITLKGNPPGELLILLDAIRDAYLREVLNKDRTDRLAQLEQVTALVACKEESLRKQRKLLDDKAEALGARDPQALRLKHQNALTQLAVIEAELSQLQLKISRQELELAGLQKRPEGQVAPDAVESAVAELLAKDPVGVALAQQIAHLQSDIADYQVKSSENFEAPGLRDKKAALASAQKSLADHRSSLVKTVNEKLAEKGRTERANSLLEMRESLNTDRQFERVLRDRIDERAREINVVTKGISGLEFLRDEIAQTEDYAKKAHARKQSLEVELEAPPRATMLEEAVIVQAPNPAKQALQTVVPALGALLLIFLAGTWLEYQSGRVSSTTEVTQRLGNVVVATVPKVTDRARLRLKPPRSGHDLREHNILADAVDMARALLLGTGTGSGPKVVMVTSAKPGEGKTSLAVQLALSLARSGQATLLIDADFRCPNLHSVFGLPVGPGLSDILQGKCEPSDAIRQQEGLSVIMAGQCDVRTVLGLVQVQLPQVLETLKRRFDFIVLDAAPVLDLPDTILLGLNADGTILSTLRDVSRLPLMQSALERLSVLNIPVLGAVLNGAPISSDYGMARRRRADPLRYV